SQIIGQRALADEHAGHRRNCGRLAQAGKYIWRRRTDFEIETGNLLSVSGWTRKHAHQSDRQENSNWFFHYTPPFLTYYCWNLTIDKRKPLLSLASHSGSSSIGLASNSSGPSGFPGRRLCVAALR